MGTLLVELDLDSSGSFATDITADVRMDAGLDIQGGGRSLELDEAGPCTLSLVLDNLAGKYTPGGPAELAGLEPWRGIRVRVSHDSVTYTKFKGVIERILPNPDSAQHSAQLTATDDMVVLEEAAVRLPMTPSQPTGVIINRLLDLAETENKVTNPHFKDDLTGYAALGGASAPTRETTGNLLHEPAVMDVVVANFSNDGAKYTFEAGKWAAGDRAEVGWYVYAATPAAEGKTMRLRLRDDVGVQATGALVTLTDTPQRAEVSGQWDGAATSFTVECVTDVAQGVFTFRSGAVQAAARGQHFARQVDQGATILENINFRLGSALAYIQAVRDNELGGLFYLAGDGKAVYESRLHRWLGDHLSSTATFSEEGRIAPKSDGALRVREVIFDHQLWDVGAPGSPVFSLAPVPRTIPANGSLTIHVEYDGGLVRAAIIPVANTDYTIVDNRGADRTGDVTLDYESFGGAAQVKFINTTSDELQLTSLGLRGTPVRTSSDAARKSTVATTKIAVAIILTHTYDLNSNSAGVQAWANHVAARYGDSQAITYEMELWTTWPTTTQTARLTDMLARAVSDRITITQDDLVWSAKVTALPVYIDRIDFNLDDNRARVVWQLAPIEPDPAVAANFAIVGTTDVGDADPIAP